MNTWKSKLGTTVLVISLLAGWCGAEDLARVVLAPGSTRAQAERHHRAKHENVVTIAALPAP